jgi:hypothetical protein
MNCNTILVVPAPFTVISISMMKSWSTNPALICLKKNAKTEHQTTIEFSLEVVFFWVQVLLHCRKKLPDPPTNKFPFVSCAF